MTPSLPALFFTIVFTATLTSSVFSQQCASMSGMPLNGCNVAGYNSTFPMPYNMSNRSRRWTSSFLSYILRTTATKNCSGLAQLGEMVVCAIYVPRCTDGKLNLPCKRVCAEFVSRCSGFVDPFWLEYYVAYCTLLPDAKPSSGKCFEPPGFDRHYNDSSSGNEYPILQESSESLSICRSSKYSNPENSGTSTVSTSVCANPLSWVISAKKT